MAFESVRRNLCAEPRETQGCIRKSSRVLVRKNRAHRHSLNRTWYALTQGGHMADIQRISAQQAHAKSKANQALLVCAYEDEAKCRMLNLDGSISFASLQSRAASLPKTQEIIFY
jgi:hypothetical protein